jgi:V/A-type H+-transporting ATPase subunit E
MAAEKIINQIKKDSENEVKHILKEAQKQASDIINYARKEAKLESEKIIANGKKQGENLIKILISKANQDTKKEIMNAREQLIEECFTKAHHKLSILKDKEYEQIVKKLIEDGLKKLGGKCAILVSRDSDKKIAKELGINIDGNVETSGGVILKSFDGRVILDHTFDGILRREKNKIRIKVGKQLFT